MKKSATILFVLSLFFLSPLNGFSQDEDEDEEQEDAKINWMSMNEALEAQEDKPKKIVLDAYTNWCNECDEMDKNTYENDDLAAYVNEHFYPVKFNAEGNEDIEYMNYTYDNPGYDSKRKNKPGEQHLFATLMKITGYPSVVFFDESGQFIAPVTGYQGPEELEMYLKMIASDEYKELTTEEAWEEYQENFESSFNVDNKEEKED